MKLLNSFSIQMIPRGGTVSFKKIDIDALVDVNVRNPKGFRAARGEGASITSRPIEIECCIGHQDLCNIVASLIEVKTDKPYRLTANRVSVCLKEGEKAIIAQYIGARLPEGATLLPEGATIEFFEITVLPEGEQLKKEEIKKKFSQLKRSWENDFEVGQHESHKEFLEKAQEIFGFPIND